MPRILGLNHDPFLTFHIASSRCATIRARFLAQQRMSSSKKDFLTMQAQDVEPSDERFRTWRFAFFPGVLLDLSSLLDTCRQPNFNWAVNETTEELCNFSYLNPKLGLQSKPVLILPEYERMWGLVAKGRAPQVSLALCFVLYVFILLLLNPWCHQTGQPGIGKSVFLLYAMVRCIVAGKPVLICDSASEPLLLINPGSRDTSFRLLQPNQESLLFCPDNTLALIDCNDDMVTAPARLRYTKFHFFICGSSAPRHWDWIRKADAFECQFYVVAWRTLKSLKQIQCVPRSPIFQKNPGSPHISNPSTDSFNVTGRAHQLVR